MESIGYQYQLTLKSFLDYGMMFNPRQIIKYRDELQFTYEEHFERVKKLSNALKYLGVQPGEAVGMLEWDTYRYLEAHWAIPLYGALFHTVNVRMAPEQIEYCINHAEDKVIFLSTDFLPLLESMKDKLPTVKAYVIMTDDRSVLPIQTTLPNVIEYEELLNKVSADYVFPEISENSRATLCYTSGTTGNPKGVVFTHRELFMHAISIGMTWGLFPNGMEYRANQTYMMLTPMFHVQAWGGPYLAFMLGNKFILPGKYEPDKILRWLHDEKVDFSHCVTTILHMLVFHPDAGKYDLSNWHVALGGAKLNRQLAERAMQLGVVAQSCYGMTETCPAMTLGMLKPEHYKLSPQEKISYFIKSGIPWVFSQFRVLDEEWNDIPHDGKAVGDIVVRTPWCTHEYFKEPEKTEQLWKNGWLNTGDVGLIDEEGYLMVTDRNKDVIKSGGEWISTLTLEDVVSQFSPVLECAVIGIPDEKWDERPCACVALKEGQSATAEEIRNWMLKFTEDGTIEKWWIPEVPNGYFFVDAIPHNYIGKIEKNTLRQMYADRIKK